MRIRNKVTALSGCVALLCAIGFIGAIYWLTAATMSADGVNIPAGPEALVSLRFWSWFIGGSVLIVAVGLGFGLGNHFTTTIMRVADVLKQINLGQLDVESIPMGKALDCGTMVGCGNHECRAHGKESHCWVEAGSFNADPQCPKAIKGLDCRDCKIYKKAISDEFDDLGSVINTMAAKLREVVGNIQKIDKAYVKSLQAAGIQ